MPRRKAFDDQVAIPVVVTCEAPKNLKDRVSVEALTENLVEEIDGEDFWPPADHTEHFDPDYPYRVTSVVPVDGYLVRLTEFTEVFPDTLVLAKGLVWKKAMGTDDLWITLPSSGCPHSCPFLDLVTGPGFVIHMAG